MRDIEMPGTGRVADKMRRPARHVGAQDRGRLLERDIPPGAALLGDVGLVRALCTRPFQETLDGAALRCRQR